MLSVMITYSSLFFKIVWMYTNYFVFASYSNIFLEYVAEKMTHRTEPGSRSRILLNF